LITVLAESNILSGLEGGTLKTDNSNETILVAWYGAQDVEV
jgi:hypothetical protein